MQKIAVIGGGLMGAGIAQAFAVHGHDVTVFEPDSAIRGTIRSRVAESLALVGSSADASAQIKLADSLAEAARDADFITEAAPERLALKQSLFAELEQHAPSSAILASNTSVIPIGQIAANIVAGDRVVGTHWWNPPYLIPLVEVIQSHRTSAATIATTMALLRSVGKKPAHIKKDLPGFVANRLQHALWREAIAMVADGICDAETLDACVKDSFGLRLAVLGPLENADLVGLDLTLDIHRTIIPELDRHNGPHELLQSLVAAERLGFKSGGGFRDWDQDAIREVRAKLIAHLVAAQQDSVQN